MTEHRPSIELKIRDMDPELIVQLAQRFGAYRGVSVGVGDLTSMDVGAIVSPTGGLGEHGLGRSILQKFGLRFAGRLKAVLDVRCGPDGYLPIGQAVAISTRFRPISHVIVAPSRAGRAFQQTYSSERRSLGREAAKAAGFGLDERQYEREVPARPVYAATRAALRCALEIDPPVRWLGMPFMGRRSDHRHDIEEMRAAVEEVLNPDRLE